MNFNIDIQISNENVQFTGHWNLHNDSWETAMNRAMTYAKLFMNLQSCNNIEYIHVTEVK